MNIYLTPKYDLFVKNVSFLDKNRNAAEEKVDLVRPQGEVKIKEGVIAIARHIHMHTNDAKKFGVMDKQRVKVKTTGERSVVFENVLVRANLDFALEMHVDIYEGNAAGLKNGDMVELIME